MKIKYSALVMGVSGKLNGSVGATNRGGAYLRNKGVVTNPSTGQQQTVRDQFGTTSSLWRELSPAQIAAWNAAAPNFPYQDRLNETRLPSGFQLFQTLNTNLTLISQARLQNPPAKQPMASVVVGATSADVSTGDISVELSTDALVPGDYRILIEATPPIPNGITFVKNKYRVVARGSITNTPALVEFGGYYAFLFGALSASNIGQTIYYRIKLISNVSGEAMVATTASAVVVV